jgi:hypothetical protein
MNRCGALTNETMAYHWQIEHSTMINPFPHVSLYAGLLAMACAVFAEENAEGDPECVHTVASVPKSVHDILNPLYTGSPTQVSLAAASEQLQTLMSQANFCRIFVVHDPQRNDARNQDNMAWKSLNQWLVRLSNFVTLNANGHDDRDWKDEYEVFAELYELKI